MMTLAERWEWSLFLVVFGPPCIGYLAYLLISEWLVWRGPRYFVQTHFPHWLPKTPVYGPAYSTKGHHAKPNLRVV